MLPQVYHVYPFEVIPIHPSPLVWLVNLSTNDEVANVRVGCTNPRIPRDYLEFVKAHLYGCLVDASEASESHLCSQINLHHLCHL